MTIFTIAGTVTLLLCSLPAVSHLQQCAYRTDKSYFKIFKSGYFVLLCVVQTASLLLLFLADRNAGDGMCVMLLCVVAVLTSRANRKSNKPLKFTARVIRLLSVQTCLYCVLCILVGVCYIAVFLPVITAIASLVCVPVGKSNFVKVLKIRRGKTERFSCRKDCRHRQLRQDKRQKYPQPTAGLRCNAFQLQYSDGYCALYQRR